MTKQLESKFSSFLTARNGDAKAAVPGHGLEKAEPRSGRLAGKRSDPAFEQVTAYIRKHTHRAVKIALLQQGNNRQFSELVEELLSEWIEATNGHSNV